MQLINLMDCDKALVYGTNNKRLSDARVLDTGSTIYLFLNNLALRDPPRTSKLGTGLLFYRDPNAP